MLKPGWTKRFKFNPDTGFGNAASTQGSRLVNHDGTFNVIRKGLPFSERVNLYHDLIRMPWWLFNTIVIAGFILINCAFTIAYMLIGIEQLQGIVHTQAQDIWFEVFTFSCQTFSTVGYGRINPLGNMAGGVAAFEALAGTILAALLTGLVFARFARPRAKLAYSNVALIAPYKEINALMFRIANARDNQLVECEISLMFSFIETETGMRRYMNLELERNRITGLPLSWTVVHPITEQSPLFELSETELIQLQGEFVFTFKAFDDTYSQVVYTRHSYHAEELVWGAKFIPMFNPSDSHEATELKMDKINAYEVVAININKSV